LLGKPFRDEDLLERIFLAIANAEPQDQDGLTALDANDLKALLLRPGALCWD
jgi:hypothetical protein